MILISAEYRVLCEAWKISKDDAESPVESEKNKPRSFADNWKEKGDVDANKKEADRLPGPHTERKRPGEGLPDRYG